MEPGLSFSTGLGLVRHQAEEDTGQWQWLSLFVSVVTLLIITQQNLYLWLICFIRGLMSIISLRALWCWKELAAAAAAALCSVSSLNSCQCPSRPSACVSTVGTVIVPQRCILLFTPLWTSQRTVGLHTRCSWSPSTLRSTMSVPCIFPTHSAVIFNDQHNKPKHVLN